MFKVGDKVRIKKNLITNNYYGGVTLNSEMAKGRGKVGTICSINLGYTGDKSLIDYPKTYKLSRVGLCAEAEKWSWTEEMLEPITSEQIEFIYDNNAIEFKYKLENATKGRKIKDVKYSATAIPESGRHDANWEYSAIIIFDE